MVGRRAESRRKCLRWANHRDERGRGSSKNFHFSVRTLQPGTPGIDAMYITDLRHFLDASGAIAPVKGAARAMAQFQADVVAHASDGTGQPLGAPNCVKCRKHAVDAALARDAAIVWQCPGCGA